MQEIRRQVETRTTFFGRLDQCLPQTCGQHIPVDRHLTLGSVLWPFLWLQRHAAQAIAGREPALKAICKSEGCIGHERREIRRDAALAGGIGIEPVVDVAMAARYHQADEAAIHLPVGSQHRPRHLARQVRLAVRSVEA